MPTVKGLHRSARTDAERSDLCEPHMRQYFPRPRQIAPRRHVWRGATTVSLALVYPLLVGVSFWPCASDAGQWYDEPRVSLQLGYDDNVRFVERNEESSFSQKLSATTALGYRTEVTDVKAKVRADLKYYSQESDLDTDDQYLDLIAKHRSGLNIFGFDGQFIRDTSRTSELETTGRVRKSKRRHSTLLAPSWTRTLDERNSLQLGYTFNRVLYDDSDETGLLDYYSHSAAGSLFHDLGELTRLSATLTYTHYKVQDTSSKANDYGFMVGAVHAFSETVDASVAAGARATTSEARNNFGNRLSDTNYGFLLNASLEKRFERTVLTGRAKRELRPTGSGRLIDSRSVGVDLRHRLSERLTFLLDTVVFRNETNNNSFNRLDDEERTFVDIRPKLRWQLTRWWDIVGSYRYRYQKYDDRNDSAKSNAFFINLTYQWPRESVSRWSEL